MAVTILGQHISCIRPSLGYQCRVYKNERPKGQYDKKPITINNGRVMAVCVKLHSDGVLCIAEAGVDVLRRLDIKPEEVKAEGWLLDNGNYVWR